MHARLVLAGLPLLAIALCVCATAMARVSPREWEDDDRPELTPGPDDALTRALSSGAISEAQYALLRVETIFRPENVPTRFRGFRESPPESATLIMRDLTLRQSDLSESEQLRAQGILARPFSEESTLYPRPDDVAFGYPADPDEVQYPPSALEGDAKYFCSSVRPWCFYYLTTTSHAVPSVDADGLPGADYPQLVLDTFNSVWAKEVVSMGYRRPKTDITSPNHGMNGGLDIYLVDMPESVYGYCTTDDPKLNQPTVTSWDMSAYCVLDNDYAPSQYGTLHTPEENLQATMAHEIFHALQFAYDYGEDGWLMEGTSTWMEDEVFDDINDSLQYLPASPISDPDVPLDTFDNRGHQYGAWVFFRFLSEQLGDPFPIRRIWELADGAQGSPDLYSIQAVTKALGEYSRSLPDTLAAFHAANAFPSLTYEEGDSYGSPPMRATRTISERTPSFATRLVLDHLAGAYVLVKPGKGVRKGAHLKLRFALPPRGGGSRATVVSISKSGTVKTAPIGLNPSGDGSTRIAFGSMRALVIVLTNADARFQCWSDTGYSCSGIPLADNERYALSARLVQ